MSVPSIFPINYGHGEGSREPRCLFRGDEEGLLCFPPAAFGALLPCSRSLWPSDAATSHKRTKDGNLANEACCFMTTGCDCLNLHPWVDGHRLHLEVQELVVLAVCPRAENGHGTVRFIPHPRKINTAVTFFDLRRFCVYRDRFYHLVCFLSPGLSLGSVNTVQITTESHSEVLCGSVWACSHIHCCPGLASPVRRFLFSPTCTVPLVHTHSSRPYCTYASYYTNLITEFRPIRGWSQI